MTKSDEIILSMVNGTLRTFKVCILVHIDGKIVCVAPDLLKNLAIEDIAESVQKTDLSEEDQIKLMEAIDYGRHAHSLISSS